MWMTPLQVGFDAVDLLARRNAIFWGKKMEHKALTAQGQIHGRRVVLCKPMGNMNVSGASVAPVAKNYGIATQNVRDWP
jgi:peptidyl-tRNA hydrolase